MELPIPPTGFERATGVIEGRRRCTICEKTFPVANHVDSECCPYCKSDATVSLSAEPGDPAGSLAR